MANRPTIKLGMSGKAGTAVGDAIFLWRNFIGLPPAKGVTNFDFGSQTKERTMAWQRSQKLSPVDGVVGPGTWARYDSLQYGPPPPAAVQAAQTIQQTAPVEVPPAAVQAAKVIQTVTPAPKPTPAAVAAAKKIPPATKPPSAAAAVIPVVNIKLPTSVAEAKEQATQATKKITQTIESTPLWIRIGGSVVGVVLAVKGVKKLFGMA